MTTLASEPRRWGITNEYAPLRDAIVSRPYRTVRTLVRTTSKVVYSRSVQTNCIAPMTTLASEPRRWGITNEYAPLRDVLLGQPEFFRWIDAGPITMRTLNNQDRTGVAFNLQTAMSQHAEMVSIYESNGVACHYLDADEILHRNFFARDSSAMTPWGALICHMQLKSRRAHYVTAIRFYHNSDIPIWRYATAGHFEGGDFNILESSLC